MEGVGPRPKWNKQAPVGSLLLMCVLFPILGLTSPQVLERSLCPEEDFLTENGICCQKCPAGKKLEAVCQAEGQRTNCERCKDGETYMDQTNYAPNCMGCTRCKKNEVVVTACNRFQNTVCRCKDGFYKEVIATQTHQCIKCTSCRAGERQTHPCTPEKNTVCECEKGYYRFKNKCLSCDDCTTNCELHCPRTVDVKKPSDESGFFKIMLVGVGLLALVLLVVVGTVTYKATKVYTKKRLQSSSPTSDVLPDSTQVLMLNEIPADNSCNEAVPQSPVSDQEPSNLPDCIPLEIKIPDLIYTVLDLVPVPQVKQLARSLGVTDTEIERAETDHRVCKEAHYQMLRVWAQRGSRAGGGGSGVMLHQPLLQELLDNLRNMQLGWAVEELETKYGIQ